jgi:hypothetical protein
MKNLKKRASSCKDYFSKTIFAISRCRIAEDNSSEDLLSRSQMHIDGHDEVVLAAQQWRRQKPRCVGGSCLFVVASSVAAAHIYRKDLPRITVSHNQLGLSLSKYIRHGLIEKINSKIKSQTCEALGQISADHSRARRAPPPIAPSRPTRRGK